MNVWAINKELRIKHFLVELVHRFGENTFTLIEHPEQIQAVEVCLAGEPGLSAYVFTFAQPPDKFAVDLFFPLPENNIVGKNENLSLDQLIGILNIHFDLA